MNISGIYLIFNRVNKKKYIGSAIDIYDRWKRHKSQLNKNKHCNLYLQKAWNKYGENAFKFSILERVPKSKNLTQREQFWMDKLDVCNPKKGYNMCPIAGSRLGSKASKETIEKIRLSKLGKSGGKRTEATKRKISEANIGKIFSEETRKKMSEAQKKYGVHKGKKKSVESIAKRTKTRQKNRELKNKSKENNNDDNI